MSIDNIEKEGILHFFDSTETPFQETAPFNKYPDFKRIDNIEE